MKYKCKCYEHLLCNLVSSKTQACRLTEILVGLDDYCESFKFSQRRYDRISDWESEN